MTLTGFVPPSMPSSLCVGVCVFYSKLQKNKKPDCGLSEEREGSRLHPPPTALILKEISTLEQTKKSILTDDDFKRNV